MNRTKAIAFTAIGFAIGFLLKNELNNYIKKISPEKALQQAKLFFEENGPITGSWIYTKVERLEKNGLIYKGYRGGISRNIDGQTHQYEFFAYIKNGTILSVKEIEM